MSAHAKTILPKDLTSYDLLKSLAVIIMIADHIGLYFYPEALWWRVIGRTGFPVWFFLVGYARGRDLPPKLLGGAGLLLLGNISAGMPVFPLSALVTIGLLRVSIDPLMRIFLKSPWFLWGGSALLFVLAIPTGFLTEYGTLAMIMAVFGYIVRHKETLPNKEHVFMYALLAFLSFIVTQFLTFSFSHFQFIIMSIGTAAIVAILYVFGLKTYPELTKTLPAPVTWLLQFGGRRTLEIYVVHLLLFKALATYWDLEGFGLLEWSWF
ncbi:MAG: hypothetical protein KDI46_07665 [Alphaproteobacteria bacterium]|nr:hypothetical protein [Alphaproteobacteria bacterium]